MSMDPNRWVNTIPFIGAKSNQEKYKLDSNKWVNTLPRKDNNTLILSNTVISNPKSGSGIKYFLTIIVFVMGLILVSAIKNGTRNLQKEINNLEASINVLKFNLDQGILDNEVITSPENISQLAKEYLDTDFVPYKKSQIRHLNDKTEIIASIKETKNKNLARDMRAKLFKKIKRKRTEIRKLQELYSKPEAIPGELKTQVAKKIEEKKIELKNLYSSPKEAILSTKAQKWLAIQVVKVFLGMPVVPGK